MKIFANIFPFCAVFALLTGGYGHLQAQWSHDPSVNTPVCTAASDQYISAIANDGSGGAIIAWSDYRSTVGHIYAQHITNTGVTTWTTDGLAICLAANGQSGPAVLSDGSGGAIIAWSDFRNGTDFDVYAQRINSSGVVQWTTDGVAICTATGFQTNPVLVSDGSGGAFITWIDARSGANDIYAQRVNNAGVVQWSQNGVPICTAPGSQEYLTAVSDAASGAIITWEDYRSGTSYDIYSQRINGSGTVQWAANGVPVSTAQYDQYFPVSIPDDSGGAFITWQDLRNGSAYHIYAQRINGSGAVQWQTDGVPVCTASTFSQQYPTLASDSSGGAIITWEDFRGGTDLDIYAQRITAAGTPQWTYNGVAVCTAANNQSNPTAVSDGAGGAIISWTDYRDGADFHTYAQRVTHLGSTLWNTNGIAVSLGPGSQGIPYMTGDGSGDAIVGFIDTRSANYDIYAQRIDNIGYLGYNNPVLSFVRDVPADQGGKVTVGFNASNFDQYPYQLVTSYSIWRGVSPTATMTAKSPGIFKASSGKTYRKIQTPQGTTYWELVGNLASHYFAGYSYTAPTLNDSDQTGTHSLQYLVSAETPYQFVFWDSNVDSGYSVDNLPPGAVQNVVAQPQTGSSVLVHWSPDLVDPDVNGYLVYRSTVSGFTPGPSTKLGQTADTSFVDPAPTSGQTNYYRIVTVDLHGNLSTPSLQATAGAYTTQSYSLDDQWNLVSVPVVVSDFTKTSLLPTAVSDAFAYGGGYMAKPTLANGTGYWLRFSGSPSISMTGFRIDQDTVNVNTGWNLIGSITSPVNVTNITSVPGGIVTSQFFGYTGGYSTVSTLEPGRGYWVKMTQSGSLILSSTASQSDAGRISIVPGSDLPPSPPGGDVPGIPGEFALGQNFPNPFNPSTEIRYQLPQSGWVTLKVFNMLGQEMSTLVNAYQDAGYKTVTVNMNSLPSGIYVYRITAGRFTDVKKMMLIK